MRFYTFVLKITKSLQSLKRIMRILAVKNLSLMNKAEIIINKIAQDKIDFNIGIQYLLEDPEYNFNELFSSLRFFIFNAIPNKADYNSDAYQDALNTIPLKSTSTPIVILKRFQTKIAFDKLSELTPNEHKNVLISLICIFKIIDNKRRNTDCKNGCSHYWHQIN